MSNITSKISIIKKKSFQLNEKEKKNIFKLKSLHYKFNIEKQKKWFTQNINKNDIHYLVYLRNKLIGYNCLRQLSLKKINYKNLKKAILFDTLVYDPNFRGKGLSKKLLNQNKIQLNRIGTIGILYCKKNMIEYYKKYNWVKIKSPQINFSQIKKKNLFPMIILKNKKNFDKVKLIVDVK